MVNSFHKVVKRASRTVSGFHKVLTPCVTVDLPFHQWVIGCFIPVLPFHTVVKACFIAFCLVHRVMTVFKVLVTTDRVSNPVSGRLRIYLISMIVAAQSLVYLFLVAKAAPHARSSSQLVPKR